MCMCVCIWLLEYMLEYMLQHTSRVLAHVCLRACVCACVCMYACSAQSPTRAFLHFSWANSDSKRVLPSNTRSAWVSLLHSSETFSVLQSPRPPPPPPHCISGATPSSQRVSCFFCRGFPVSVFHKKISRLSFEKILRRLPDETPHFHNCLSTGYCGRLDFVFSGK